MHLFSGVRICEYFRVSAGTACLRAGRYGSFTRYTYLSGEIDCSHIPTDNVFGTQNIFTLVFHFFTLSLFNGARQTSWM